MLFSYRVNDRRIPFRTRSNHLPEQDGGVGASIVYGRACMADEIELKLELTADGADAIAASGLLPGDPDIAAQRSIYFDTPDQDLAKTGLSLRIRRSGKKRIQTVQADGASAAGQFVRSEWECAVTEGTPNLEGQIGRAPV